LAIADQDCERILNLSPGHSEHSLVYQPGFTSESQTVPCTPLDGFCTAQAIDKVDFIKMDIEGAEITALRGMTATIEKNPAICMVVEVNPGAQVRSGQSTKELIEALQSLL
jgi:FkbM family methyltransferase